jgi:hypothetical protein
VGDELGALLGDEVADAVDELERISISISISRSICTQSTG